jgi:hypothetical protein
MDTNRDRLNALMGLALIGGSVTGALSLVAALFPLFEGDFVGVGVCLVAAALSFGLLANAFLHD